jgi:hypothetical protein
VSRRLPPAVLDDVAAHDTRTHHEPAQDDVGQPRPLLGQWDEEREWCGRCRAEQQGSGRAETVGEVGRTRGARDPTRAHAGNDGADNAWGQTYLPHQEDDQDGLVAGERQVGEGPERRECPQVEVRPDEPHARADLLPPSARIGRRSRRFSGADAKQACSPTPGR